MKKIIIIVLILSFFKAWPCKAARPGLVKPTTNISVFTQKINRLLPEPQAGLLNGILFGEKARMDGKFFDQLRRTGTLHVIALSGMNITILVNLLGQMTLFLGRRKSIVLSIIMIIIFIWFVGASASVVRAGIMGGITLIGLYFGRQSWALLTLLIAAGMMLLFKPIWLYDLGFQLSFLATLGIILLGSNRHSEQTTRHPEFSSGSEPGFPIRSGMTKKILKQVQNDIGNDLRTTLAAQVFTLPVLLYNFKQLSIVAPLTNVLVLWIVQPIMVLGLMLSIVSYVSNALAMPLAWIIWVPLTYFIKIIEITAGIPFASISF